MVVSMTAVGPVGSGGGASCGLALGASGSEAGCWGAVVWGAAAWALSAAGANVAVKSREEARSLAFTV